jgi:outer membrane protein insertion porin family
VDYAFRFFGADFEFTKYQAEYVHYLPLWEGTLVGRVRASASSGVLPIQEQYTLGGQASVRACRCCRPRGNSAWWPAWSTACPWWPCSQTCGHLRGGLADAGGVSASGVGFVDTWQFSYGLGVLVNSPIGPIRIDYAVGPGGQTQTWLYFGHPF